MQGNGQIEIAALASVKHVGARRGQKARFLSADRENDFPGISRAPVAAVPPTFTHAPPMAHRRILSVTAEESQTGRQRVFRFEYDWEDEETAKADEADEYRACYAALNKALPHSWTVCEEPETEETYDDVPERPHVGQTVRLQEGRRRSERSPVREY